MKRTVIGCVSCLFILTSSTGWSAGRVSLIGGRIAPPVPISRPSASVPVILQAQSGVNVEGIAKEYGMKDVYAFRYASGFLKGTVSTAKLQKLQSDPRVSLSKDVLIPMPKPVEEIPVLLNNGEGLSVAGAFAQDSPQAQILTMGLGWTSPTSVRSRIPETWVKTLWSQ